MTTRPPERRIVVPDFSAETKDIATQLRSFANDLMKQARANIKDPDVYKPAIQTIALIGDRLRVWGDNIPLDGQSSEHIDIAALEKRLKG